MLIYLANAHEFTLILSLVGCNVMTM